MKLINCILILTLELNDMKTRLLGSLATVHTNATTSQTAAGGVIPITEALSCIRNASAGVESAADDTASQSLCLIVRSHSSRYSERIITGVAGFWCRLSCLISDAQKATQRISLVVWPDSSLPCVLHQRLKLFLSASIKSPPPIPK
jgi:hypothetical protein